MSVLFTAISSDNPVTNRDVRKVLEKIDVQPSTSDESDFTKLLQVFHGCMEVVESLPDYQPGVDYHRFPRLNIKRPSLEENVLGHAWSYTFSIKDTLECNSLLRGKTICLKDCIAVAEIPQVMGTDVFDPWVPVSDATIVRGEIVGTAQSENLCQSTSSNSSAQGVIENPRAYGYSAGGSTSGAAALVGAGLVDIGLGADQGGSVRVPASLCGLVGLKPTFGLIPYTGIASNDAVDDHAGILARTVLEVAQCLEATAGYDGLDDRQCGAPPPNKVKFAVDLKACESLGVQGMRIGILQEAFGMPLLNLNVRDKVMAAANKFKELGAHVEEVSIPFHPTGNAIWTIQQRFSGCLTLLGCAHGRRGVGLPGLEKAKCHWDQAKFDKSFATTQNILLNGLYLLEHSPDLYCKALNLIRKLREDYEAALQSYDVLILPTTSFVARKHGSRTTPPIEQIAPTLGLTANTVQFNATGHPAMSIPIGKIGAEDDSNVMLPVGMQIVSGLWRDDKVLRVGHAWEKAFDWESC
ncbi:hypothetical protein AYL99_11305 [Fonsecaea erecta]|uniref:Amidase domain-containing protein n=1 Tax=Fonsecaea erecta TaxID=1367422 RepID=A0A178Z529_9EURO|nr:hypothetical protein AYL99_11305 [Fonsecaea erecta]OAP54857.1 hypothetical protein AYL99_11305 [Fonsecaea erecta]